MFAAPRSLSLWALAAAALWIEPLPAEEAGKAAVAPAAAAAPVAAIDWQEARTFWAFQRPRVRAVPETGARADWSRVRLDGFVLAGMAAAGLSPSPEADPRIWFRRVSFDLTGLPPTAAEMAVFLADLGGAGGGGVVGDHSPDREAAYGAAVDRLLDSPHFGERWARLWLDVARYAEDQAHIVGNNTALNYPNAWRYRDWVIGAFNADLPYDRFLRLQLAADLLAPADEGAQAAMGFIGIGPKYYRRGDAAVMADEWEDRVDTVTRGLLGLTVACARCHDHKYDPIPTTDYYALAGVFANTEMFNRPLDAARPVNGDGQAKSEADALHIIREKPRAGGRDLAVHLRGDAATLGEVVPRRFLTVLGSGDTPFTSENSGRLDLAAAIASPANPLTARVWVNRVWAACFGAPLVGTASNFGVTGERPTHPDLLDDLAARFMGEGGWSLKWLVREIALSSTYRQSAAAEPAKRAADPENRWLSRMNRRRLPVEMWRDALFAASGRLDRQVGGPSIEASRPDAARRAVYSRISRLQLDPLLELFDFPDPNLHSEGRNETVTPLQKLFVLNHPLMVAQADAVAARFGAAAGGEADRIAAAYRELYGREPDPEELRLGETFLASVPAGGAKTPWQQYAQVLLASNELLYLD